nr:glycosyltransferase family A protein [uncultured Carboxylicivirga sp.]
MTSDKINTNLVSIIIPCYNCEVFLSQTLDSVINQSYSNIEIIIVDDGSTDLSINLANQYKSKNADKIQVYQNPGKGACAARNYGFKQSKGFYIQFLDGDDILSKDKIKMQVKSLQSHINHVAICETWHFHNHIDNAINTDRKYLENINNIPNFFIQLWGGSNLMPNMVQTSAWLLPRTLIENYGLWDTTLLKDQDGEFFARVVLNANGIIYTPGIKNYYRKHIYGNNIAAQKKKEHFQSNKKAIELKQKYLFHKTYSPEAKLAIATQYKILAIDAWPNYIGLANEAINNCKKLGGSNYQPILGGKIIEIFKKMFGWKFTKALSFYIHKLI